MSDNYRYWYGISDILPPKLSTLQFTGPITIRDRLNVIEWPANLITIKCVLFSKCDCADLDILPNSVTHLYLLGKYNEADMGSIPDHITHLYIEESVYNLHLETHPNLTHLVLSYSFNSEIRLPTSIVDLEILNRRHKLEIDFSKLPNLKCLATPFKVSDEVVDRLEFLCYQECLYIKDPYPGRQAWFESEFM